MRGTASAEVERLHKEMREIWLPLLEAAEKYMEPAGDIDGKTLADKMLRENRALRDAIAKAREVVTDK